MSRGRGTYHWDHFATASVPAMDEVAAAGTTEVESVDEHAYLVEVEVETADPPAEETTGADELLPGELPVDPPLARFHTGGPGMV
jgi:hypothetical protein